VQLQFIHAWRLEVKTLTKRRDSQETWFQRDQAHKVCLLRRSAFAGWYDVIKEKLRHRRCINKARDTVKRKLLRKILVEFCDVTRASARDQHLVIRGRLNIVHREIKMLLHVWLEAAKLQAHTKTRLAERYLNARHRGEVWALNNWRETVQYQKYVRTQLQNRAGARMAGIAALALLAWREAVTNRRVLKKLYWHVRGRTLYFHIQMWNTNMRLERKLNKVLTRMKNNCVFIAWMGWNQEAIRSRGMSLSFLLDLRFSL
jgi:hypothetical protein